MTVCGVEQLVDTTGSHLLPQPDEQIRRDDAHVLFVVHFEV